MAAMYQDALEKTLAELGVVDGMKMFVTSKGCANHTEVLVKFKKE